MTIQALGWRSDFRYLPLQDDISSVGYWYQGRAARRVSRAAEPEFSRNRLSAARRVQMNLLPHAEAAPRRFLRAVPASRPQPVLSVPCPRIDYHNWRTWSDVGDALGSLVPMHFGQAWLPADEADLQPGAVALAHHESDLIVYAELSDTDIFNPVREHGAHAYAHGDVFEIFLRADGAPNYFEHHITPDNITLQLSFPTPTAFAENCTGDSAWSLPFATAIPVPSPVLVQPGLNLWRVLAIVPLARIASMQAPLPRDWRFSFCRYDHTHGRAKPVLSSTTPYRFANFHHQDMWGRLRLEGVPA